MKVEKCIKIVIICKSINFFSFKFLTATTCSSIFNLDRSIVNYKSYLHNNQRPLSTCSKLALRTCLILKSSVSIQTKLCSHWFNYHYMRILKNCSQPFNSQIKFVILINVNHTILIMLVQRS